MNLLYKLHNTLIHMELLPPPISVCNVNNISLGSATLPLLHQAYASCGRAFGFYLLLCLLPLGFASCEKPQLRYAELEAYYAESQNLEAAPRDSVLRFYRKVQSFVTINPDAKEDPLYPEIRRNISLVLSLTDSSWGEDITITFGGSADGTNNGNSGSTATDSATVSSGNIDIDTTWAGYTYMQF